LHRANSGYLVLDARRILLQPFAWEELKRVLRAREIRIESLAQTLSLISTVTLEPEPIPLDLKVVLVGDRLLYYLLCALDPDFGELFKVPVDFADDAGRTPDTSRAIRQASCHDRGTRRASSPGPRWRGAGHRARFAPRRRCHQDLASRAYRQ
jgi:predicted ATP-dependent protease